VHEAEPPLATALTALAICAGAATLEGLFAGPGVRQRLAEVHRPRYSPPFGIWIVIGFGYYAICFTLLFRLLRSGLGTPRHKTAVALVILVLLVNAIWNYYFFRRKDLWRSLLLNVPYVLIAFGLGFTLFRLNDGSGWIFVPYLVYLPYAVWYGYATWRLNGGQ